jgi:hypothetical protein
MIRFINKIFEYTFYFMATKLLLLLLFLLIERILQHNTIDSEQDVSMVGNSHLRNGVDDKILENLIKKDFKNYGGSGQAMFWSLVEAEKQIYKGSKYIFIELNNGTYTTGWKKTDFKRGMREIRNMYFLSLDQFFNMAIKSPIFTFQMYFLKTQLPHHSSSSGLGFIELDNNFKRSIVAGNRVLKKNTFDYDNSEIVDFVKKHENVNFLIFRAPQHPELYNTIDQLNENFLVDNLNDLKNFKNCTIIDFGHMYSEDSLFHDLEHLSAKGAKKFSIALADTLKKIDFFKNY